jgi:hypothetical protein
VPALPPPQICGTIKWRLNNKSAKVRQQAADLIGRVAAVMHKCEEDQLLGHLGVVLYEYLGARTHTRTHVRARATTLAHSSSSGSGSGMYEHALSARPRVQRSQGSLLQLLSRHSPALPHARLATHPLCPTQARSTLRCWVPSWAR